MRYRECVAQFECQGEALVGILATPIAGFDGTQETAVLIVVGGPQYRGGSHRQFVSLARALASRGYPTMRFDYRGMGDSTGDPVGFEHTSKDIVAAMEALRRLCPQVRRIVLWGLCDGASASLLSLGQVGAHDVVGLVLLNPWVRSEATLARTHVRHYYLQRLRQRDFWAKLLSGGIARQAVAELARNARMAFGSEPKDDTQSRPFQRRMAHALRDFEGRTALMLSGDDYTAKEFIDHANVDPIWQAGMSRQNVKRFDFESADHTFSDRGAHRALEAATLEWLNELESASESRSNSTTLAES